MNGYRDSYFPGTEKLGVDEMRVTALGTGRPFVRLSQANASWLVELGNGSIFVLDFGFGSFGKFTALEIPTADITALIATHLHSDHVGDFPAFWIGGWVGGRLAPLQVYGPSGSRPEHGIQHFVNRQTESYAWDSASRRGVLPAVGEQVEVHEFDYAQTRVVYDDDDTKIISFPALHQFDGPVSYRIDYRGRCFVYSGDTVPNSNFIENATGADLLVHEVFNTVGQLITRSGYDEATARAVGTGIHTSPVDAGRVFAFTNPRLAVAYHFLHDFDTGPEIEAEIRQHYSGPLVLARDHMVFNLTPDTVKTRMAVVSQHAWPNKSRHEHFGDAKRGPQPEISDWLAATRLRFDG
jgi:ribonuclease Z